MAFSPEHASPRSFCQVGCSRGQCRGRQGRPRHGEWRRSQRRSSKGRRNPAFGSLLGWCQLRQHRRRQRRLAVSCRSGAKTTLPLLSTLRRVAREELKRAKFLRRRQGRAGAGDRVAWIVAGSWAKLRSLGFGDPRYHVLGLRLPTSLAFALRKSSNAWSWYGDFIMRNG